MILVIAEPGCTAEGDLGTMIEQIDMVAARGANIYKAQWTSDPAAMVARRHAPAYAQVYQWLAFPAAWHESLARRCAMRDIRYACSVYLAQDAAVVAPHVAFVKVSSFEAADPVLIEAALATGREVIISTGMMSREQVEALDYGSHVTLLHCVSAYPAPITETNLSVLTWQRADGFGPVFSGLSDHSRNVLMGGFAVCAGAQILEAHVAHKGARGSNPDFPVTFTPDEFVQYVRHIRTAEAIMGDGVKRAMPSEDAMRGYQVTA